MFKVKADFVPTGDQPQAIEKLAKGVMANLKNQVLLGVSGSGKTFTMAKVIENVQMPTLIISHNKTLAGQLYQEMRNFFPNNAVSYFISYYDYYQPEAYLPTTDTYIEKEADINQLIDKLRLQTTTNILTRNDVIVVASVSCIYNIGSPTMFQNLTIRLNLGDFFNEKKLAYELIKLQYERSEFDFKRGSFRIRDNYLDLYPAYEDFGYRIYHKDRVIERFITFDPITGIENQKSKIKDQNDKSKIKNIVIYPAKHYITNESLIKQAEAQIRADLKKESTDLKKSGKIIEAERLIRKVNYDLEMLKEVGYVNGIENYSRYFDNRAPGEPPYTLLNYFKQTYGDNFLVFIDESHMTVPQLRGMYHGDRSRKNTLIEFGFRLKSALDNRPLTFDEFYQLPSKIIYVSATPDDWELKKAKNEATVEQLIRPTGIPDPQVMIRSAKNEIEDLLQEITNQVKAKNKVLVTTLTKRIAEDLTDYLKEKKIRAEYLHSEVHTLERSDILDNLRKGEFDVLIGINLLREGLDLPEVALVAILDGDKEGFLRSKTALIQTMGRAARNLNGRVIIYADKITNAIKEAIDEIERRRKYQLAYNQKHKIKPKTIYKPVREKIIEAQEEDIYNADRVKETNINNYLVSIKTDSLTPYDKNKLIKRLEKEMRKQALELNFELAIRIREKVKELKENLEIINNQ
jgi:excinuclease ABC subunit B